MNNWLDPMRAALDARETPCEIFFRDDDAGWEDDRLRALLDRFARVGMPIDLAVIPMALTAPLARELRQRVADAPALLGLHQHGYAHVNHESAGRRCEFGTDRSREDQRRDIERGASRMWDRLGPVVDPVFTPPWNRCTSATGHCLLDLGFRVLSREHRAEPLGLHGLAELPVTIDWCRREDGGIADAGRVADRVVAGLRGERPVGIMLHHAVMAEPEQAQFAELLALLSGHHGVRPLTMRRLAGIDSGVGVGAAAEGVPA